MHAMQILSTSITKNLIFCCRPISANTPGKATHTPADLGAHAYRLVGVNVPMVSVIEPINADSNVEFELAINPQLALEKEVSVDNLAPQVYI